MMLLFLYSLGRVSLFFPVVTSFLYITLQLHYVSVIGDWVFIFDHSLPVIVIASSFIHCSFFLLVFMLSTYYKKNVYIKFFAMTKWVYVTQDIVESGVLPFINKYRYSVKSLFYI